MVKFIYSEKATLFCEISANYLSHVLIIGVDFAKLCGLFRIYELMRMQQNAKTGSYWRWWSYWTCSGAHWTTLALWNVWIGRTVYFWTKDSCTKVSIVAPILRIRRTYRDCFGFSRVVRRSRDAFVDIPVIFFGIVIYF